METKKVILKFSPSAHCALEVLSDDLGFPREKIVEMALSFFMANSDLVIDYSSKSSWLSSYAIYDGTAAGDRPAASVPRVGSPRVGAL